MATVYSLEPYPWFGNSKLYAKIGKQQNQQLVAMRQGSFSQWHPCIHVDDVLEREHDDLVCDVASLQGQWPLTMFGDVGGCRVDLNKFGFSTEKN
jgi:hypothetical protein